MQECEKLPGKSIVTPRILLLDDDESIRESLTRILQAYSYNVEVFAHPRQLLAAEIPTHNACLILDFNLPEMSGIEVSRRLTERGCHLPVVMLTGSADSETNRTLLEQVKPVAAFTKPFDLQLLVDALERALAASRQATPA